MAESRQLDLVVSVTTPENIQFDYVIAGPFRRLPALLLDIFFRYGLLFLIFLLFLFFGVATQSFIRSELFVAAGIVALFLLSWFYGLFFETWLNGQTPGKRVLGLRVVSVDGRPINAAQAAIRNFVRVADVFPYASLRMFGNDFPDSYILPTFLVALMCMILTKRFQRLGDLAAGTMVVVDERDWRSRGIQIDEPRMKPFS